MTFTFPLKIHFRLIAFAPRVDVRDAEGKTVLYVEQKVFALKEAVKVFNNSEEKKLLFTQQAESIIDFGATYHFKSAEGKSIGAIRQEGVKSLFRASYIVLDPHGKEVYRVTQTNPLIALLDTLVSIIPFAELLTGFIFNPTYAVSEKEDGDAVMTMKKKPSLLESEFEISLDNSDVSKEKQLLLVLSLLMIVQLEKERS